MPTKPPPLRRRRGDRNVSKSCRPTPPSLGDQLRAHSAVPINNIIGGGLTADALRPLLRPDPAFEVTLTIPLIGFKGRMPKCVIGPQRARTADLPLDACHGTYAGLGPFQGDRMDRPLITWAEVTLHDCDGASRKLLEHRP